MVDGESECCMVVDGLGCWILVNGWKVDDCGLWFGVMDHGCMSLDVGLQLEGWVGVLDCGCW